MRRFFKILFVALCFTPALHAQNYAYFYIEGDQQTPFYVKVEGKMQERFGENYFIIPDLDAGYTHFEILFQKNVYPSQKFLLEVPKSGGRGFVLHKVNDRQFALYDLQQKRYVISGNTEEDDHAPETASYVADTSNQEALSLSSTDNVNELPKFVAVSKADKDKINKEPVPDANKEPQFLSGIELNTDAPAAASDSETALTPEEKRAERKLRRKEKRMGKQDLSALPALKYDDSTGLEMNQHPDNNMEADLPPLPNTDCPNAMNNDEFEDFALKFLDQSDDSKKLKFLRKNKSKLCFSTEQVRIIAKSLDTQSGRYEAVKMLYIQTSDQENYEKLKSLFNTPFLKNKFEEIINPS